MSGPNIYSAFNAIRWLDAVNDGSQDIPPFAICEVTGSTTRSEGNLSIGFVVKVKRPTEASKTGCFVNGPKMIKASGGRGVVTCDSPCLITYNTGGTPAYGEVWGSAADSFELTKGNSGWRILGGHESGRVFAERVEAGGSTFKTLYLPEQDTANYVIPQKLDSTAYGLEWTPSLTDYFNFGDEELPIIDYFHSIALPGQWLTCEYSAALEAWTPVPSGQNAIQKARTYKTIEANSIVAGDNIWIMAHDANETEVFEISDMNNDAVAFEWATSGTDIEASESEPAEIWLYLMSGGWQVIGRACNP